MYGSLGDHVEPTEPGLSIVESGRAVLDQLRAGTPGVVVIDDQLQDMRGIELLKQLRQRPETESLPLIFVSGRSEEIDRVIAFELGADDFVAKPFSPRELVLRIQAVRRRGQWKGERPLESFEVGPLRIDVPGHVVAVEGNVVQLTALEFRLLVDLAQRRGNVQRRSDLLKRVWRHPHGLETRTVDTHVKRLREKLGNAGYLVETVRGVGYRLHGD